MGGTFTVTHQRIAPANQMHWLLERKLAIKADCSKATKAISWWLDNQDIAPEATCLALYFLYCSNSTADEERRFRNLRWLLSLYRHRLRPRTLELLLFMQRERRIVYCRTFEDSSDDCGVLNCFVTDSDGLSGHNL
jgi:hypothetical protein